MRSGWFNQSYRHSLAARGIRTSTVAKWKEFAGREPYMKFKLEKSEKELPWSDLKDLISEEDLKVAMRPVLIDTARGMVKEKSNDEMIKLFPRLLSKEEIDMYNNGNLDMMAIARERAAENIVERDLGNPYKTLVDFEGSNPEDFLARFVGKSGGYKGSRQNMVSKEEERYNDEFESRLHEVWQKEKKSGETDLSFEKWYALGRDRALDNANDINELLDVKQIHHPTVEQILEHGVNGYTDEELHNLSKEELEDLASGCE